MLLIRFALMKIWSVSGGNDVVEEVALDVFVGRPFLFVAENVNLNRNAIFSGLQLSHNHSHIVVDVRIVVDVFAQVSPENAEVGLLSSVDDLACVDAVGFVVFEDFLFASFKVRCYE